MGMRACVACFALWLSLPPAANAQCPPGEQLQYSADIPVAIAPVFAYDHDYLIDSGTELIRAGVDGIPERADLDALHIDPDYDVLFSLDIGATIGGVQFERGDLVQRSGAGVTIVFDASAASIPARVDLDAAARRGANLLLSFDTAFTLGSTHIRPADIVEFNGTTLVGKTLDAAALGLAERLDIDAVHESAPGELLLSFDSGGTVGAPPLTFADEDILMLVLATGAWTKPCTMLTRSDRWGRANLDALSATPGGEGVFKDGFE